MDWIKMCKNLEKKREVILVSKLLCVDKLTVIGACFIFWVWLDSETDDGQILGFSLSDIDAIVGLDGFGEAMQSVGWLVSDDAGVIVPNYDYHMCKSAKKRAMKARRQGDYLAKKQGARNE